MGKSMKNENEAIIRDEELRWLLNAIQEVAKTGIRPDGLYWRASYTPEDAAAVALLKSYMEQAGMRVFFDAVGNLHGVTVCWGFSRRSAPRADCISVWGSQKRPWRS